MTSISWMLCARDGEVNGGTRGLGVDFLCLWKESLGIQVEMGGLGVAKREIRVKSEYFSKRESPW